MEKIDKDMYFKDLEARDARIAELEAALKAANSRADAKESELAKAQAMLEVSENNVSKIQGLMAEMAADLRKYSERIFSMLIKTYATKADALLRTRKALDGDISQDADGEAASGEGSSEESIFFSRLGKNGRPIEMKGDESRRERNARKGRKKASKPREALDDVDLPTEHITLEDSEKLQELIDRYGEDRVLRIGEDRTVFIDLCPMSLKKVVVHLGKYAVKGKPEEGIAKADPLPRMLPKTKIGDRLLSSIIADKFIYRVSYAMCSELFKTCGYGFDRREFSRWQMMATEQLEPLYGLIREHLRGQDSLQMDETPVVVDTPADGTKKKKYMWSMQIANVDRPAALFAMGPGRNGEVALDMLGDFSGYLQSDSYSAYSKTAKVNCGVTNVSCAAHMRRKFVDAFNVSKGCNVTAEAIVHEFDEIFDEEWELRRDFKEGKMDEQTFLGKRKELISPHMDSIEELAKQKPVNTEGTVLESPRYEDAASYCLKHLDELRRFLDRAELTPSNNLAERGFKDVNRVLDSCYKFGSDRGADSAALIFTLLRSAQLNGLDAHGYLEYVMVNAAKILSCAKDAPSWEDLLPWNVDRNDEAFKFPDLKTELEKLQF